MQDIKGTDLPENSDTVEFQHRDHPRGPRAQQVEVVERARIIADERPICPSCGRRFVPRLIIHHGVVHRSVCPFCATTYQDSRDPNEQRNFVLGFGVVAVVTAIYLYFH